MLGKLPKLALWLAGIHLVVVGGLGMWMLVYGATAGAHREGAAPIAMLIGEAVIMVADFPSLFVAMTTEKSLGLSPTAGMSLLVVLGTLQWLLIGIVVDRILRRLRAGRTRPGGEVRGAPRS